jgi:hypothetical protein
LSELWNLPGNPIGQVSVQLLYILLQKRKGAEKMKVAWTKFTIVGYLIFVLTACTQVSDPNVPDDMSSPSSENTPTALIPPQSGDPTPMTPSISTPATSGLEGIIHMAREDLAQRLAVAEDQINVIETVEVEWSDSSLDCPQPGMEYLQVITPGYRIVLEAGGTQYEYHSNRDAYVVFCDNTNPPVLPKP